VGYCRAVGPPVPGRRAGLLRARRDL